MYSNEKSNTLNWKDIIVKIIFTALFVLLLIWLFPKVPNMTAFYSNVFRENISYMETAAKDYYTTDRLPTVVGDSVEMTLQEMYDKNLLIPFVDEDGKSCNVYSSYVQVTKNEKDYTLKVNLECNTETDFIEATLGCHDNCGSSSCGSTCGDLQYQYQKPIEKEITSYKCKSGYVRSGKYCYKTTTTDKKDAEAVYSKDEVKITDALKNTGEKVKIYTDAIETKGSDKYVCPDGSFVASATATCKTLLNTVISSTASTTKRIPSYSTETYDCNCKTQTVNTCASISGCYNYVTKTVCSTCSRTVTSHTTVTVPGSTTYSCPAGTDTTSGSGSSLKCYRIDSPTTVSGSSTYSCPTGYTEEGTGSSLKCYKYEEQEGTYYCADKDAQLKGTKCYKTESGKLIGYKCPSGYVKSGKVCYKKSTQKVKAEVIKSTKTTYEYKWSCKSVLEGWTKTGKTR